MDHFEAKTQELQTALQKGIDSLRSEYQDELTRCRADLQARTVEVDKLKVERDTALVDCAEKKKQFDQRENDLKSALSKEKKAQNRLSVDLQGRSDEVVKLQAERDTALADCAVLKKKSDERSAMSSESKAKSALDDLIEDMTKHREENALLKKRNAEFALRDAASEAEVKKLRLENAQLKKENNELASQLANETDKSKKRMSDGVAPTPKKKYKFKHTGPIRISTFFCDVNSKKAEPYIKFIKLLNSSDRDIEMGGWRLTCSTGSDEESYTFTPKTAIRSNSAIRVCSSDSDEGSAPPFMFKLRKGHYWPLEKEITKISLFNERNEEKATLRPSDEDA